MSACAKHFSPVFENLNILPAVGRFGSFGYPLSSMFMLIINHYFPVGRTGRPTTWFVTHYTCRIITIASAKKYKRGIDGMICETTHIRVSKTRTVGHLASMESAATCVPV